MSIILNFHMSLRARLENISEILSNVSPTHHCCHSRWLYDIVSNAPKFFFAL